MSTIIGAGFTFLIWVILIALTAVIAERKGHKGVGYCLLSVFLTPLIGLLIVAGISDRTKKECPLCFKMIDVRASVCAYCGRDLKNNSVNNKKQTEKAEAESI